MKGLFVFTSLCSLTGLFPFVLGIKKFKLIYEKHYPFLFYVSIACIVEIIGRLLIIFDLKDLSRIFANFYILFEGMIFVYLFFLWGVLKRRSILFIIFAFLLFTWLANNLVFNTITDINSLYRVLYSIITVLLAIKLFQKLYFNAPRYIEKDPLAIISATLIINYTYRAVFESLYLFKLDFSNNFYFSAFLIFIILNAFSNCTFTYAIHCMGLRKRLSSFY